MQHKLCNPKIQKTTYLDDKRVVYAVKCTECDETYLGQTTRPLRARIAQHLNSIQIKTTHHMSHHFNKSHHIKHFNFDL